MTLHDLAELTNRMRVAQRAYFRTRSPADLAESRRLERAVDAALRTIFTQPTLFPAEPKGGA